MPHHSHTHWRSRSLTRAVRSPFRFRTFFAAIGDLPYRLTQIVAIATMCVNVGLVDQVETCPVLVDQVGADFGRGPPLVVAPHD
jgi:hypothetical protein